MTSTVVAAFDVDRTLTTRDCVLPFLLRCRPATITAARCATSSMRLIGATIRKDRDQIKQIATRAALAGQSVENIEQLAREYADHIAENWLRTDTLARLQWHQNAGHRVVFVSASYEIYLRPLAALLGVEAVLATRLSVQGTHFTGALDGPNCRGEEKARRLLQWITTEVGDRSSTVVWAYGDSPGDRALLSTADHPVWVDRHLVHRVPDPQC
jgi:phosphatidylglycerophosphatase C